MAELYRRLLLDKEELGSAVDAAESEHFFPDDAELRLTSIPVLALEAFLDGVTSRVGVDVREQSALDVAERVVRANGGDLGNLPYTTLLAQGGRLARLGLIQAWRLTWMMDEMPENNARFAIDYDRAIEVASGRNHHPE